MSRVILAKPTRLPSRSRIASSTASAQNRVPSLRTRQYSLLPSTGFGGSLQGCCWLLRSAVLGGKKSGEMLPDYFAFRIPLQAFGTGIPTRDRPIKIEHIDRIIGHGPDEHLKPGSTAQPWPCGRFLRVSCQIPLPNRSHALLAKQANTIWVPVLA